MSIFSSIEPISQWLVPDNISLPVIAGPCSAESREQLVNTAKELSKNPNLVAFRAGLWKPRTRPGGFEGVGEKGLPWLKEIKENLGLKVCTEVATPQHIEMCLKFGIDFFWIGARTTGNPFSVSEICEAVKGTNIPILIKNPMTPDLQLWSGTIERFLNSGCTKLVAVHRGFNLNHNSAYRNAPYWNITIELQRLYPELPLFCDPSHIAGKRTFLQEISQKALDINFKGLMIESHINPEEALTDKEQQIAPDGLQLLLNNLKVRKNASEMLPNEYISLLRKNIDDIDKELLHILSKRTDIIRTMAEIKRENNMSVLQINRWNEVLKNVSDLATEIGLDQEFVQHLMSLIHNESIRIQNLIINKKHNNDE
ncbi:bifunctional 3-deoxy-7-phosphoheptulonate synthase/chorismate mutase type II [Bacteroidales bacterium OttesenSCG-928-C19]|nr:bifunctional 3-deoxy-7-phosphoheptulonate synthase/chorismate mutase type II [Bacteroidales bacterium OttesenSCG-928-C19]